MQKTINTRNLKKHEVIFVLYNLASGFTPEKKDYAANKVVSSRFFKGKADILQLAQSHTQTGYGLNNLGYFRGIAMKLNYREMYTTGTLSVDEYLRERGGLVKLEKLQSAIDEYDATRPGLCRRPSKHDAAPALPAATGAPVASAGAPVASTASTGTPGPTGVPTAKRSRKNSSAGTSAASWGKALTQTTVADSAGPARPNSASV